jgi:hypothetical protein
MQISSQQLTEFTTNMTKRLYVSSAVQAKLLTAMLIPQMKDGFWKDHRPADHYKEWEGVEVQVSVTDQLGAVGFTVPRNYNFVNPEFLRPNEAELVAVAQSVKASSNFRSVKKELIELSWIVGGRLTSKTGARVKANRGTNKTDGSISSAKATVATAASGVKRTAVKKPVDGPNVEIIKTSQGATVRRVAVTKA